jgi:hypothetical protein
MKHPFTTYSAIRLLPLLALPAHAQTDWKAGGGNNDWSNTANWSTGVVPNANTVDARFNINNNVEVEVDGSYTVKSYSTGFAANVSNAANQHLLYGDTLTIDMNNASAAVGIQNRSGNNIKLNLSCDVIINNTLSGETQIRNENGANNILEFGSSCALTLSTRLRTLTNPSNGSIVFNCTFSPSAADLFIGSNNVSFGATHSSASFGRDIVMLTNSKLAVDGGTVLNTGRKFQVNGTGAELELNAADAVNDANIIVGSTHNFLVDVNANQANMGVITVTDGVLTIDLDPAVTNLSFSKSAAQVWGSGSITIIGFKENTIRFGEDATGLTIDQLQVIDGGIYSLTPTGFLTAGNAGNEYPAWAASQNPPVIGGENGDDDNDGVKNLVEYALADGGERGVFSGTTISFTKRGAPYGSDLTYIIETSETLADPWLPVVTQGPAELGSPLSYDLAPTPGTPKKFARLKVVATP